MEQKKQNILVTGGAGYLGDTVVENLLGVGHKVTIVDSLVYTDSYMRPGVDFIQVDIRSSAFDAIMMNKFDAVIHLAAVVGDAACQQNPIETFEINEEAVLKLVRLVHKDTRLIFASTCSVYGANNNILTESSPINPLSLYAGTKLNAEEFVKKHSNHVIFRLGTLFGLSGPFGRIRADLVTNVLTFKACEGEKLTVFGGDQWRPLVHTKDVGRIFAESVDKQYTGTYILSHQNYKILDVAKAIDKIVTSGGLEVTDIKFEDLRNYRVDNSKAKGVGIQTKISLEDGIREIYKAYEIEGRIKNPWISQYHNAKYIKEQRN